jgi:hypothetical protein
MRKATILLPCSVIFLRFSRSLYTMHAKLHHTTIIIHWNLARDRGVIQFRNSTQERGDCLQNRRDGSRLRRWCPSIPRALNGLSRQEQHMELVSLHEVPRIVANEFPRDLTTGSQFPRARQLLEVRPGWDLMPSGQRPPRLEQFRNGLGGGDRPMVRSAALLWIGIADVPWVFHVAVGNRATTDYR